MSTNQRKILFLGLLPLFPFLLIAAQDSTKSLEIPLVSAGKPVISAPLVTEAPPVAVVDNYLVGPLDVLRFRIVGEEATATELRVAQDGSVNLPYIGNVVVSGMNVSQIREFLFELYNKDWYVNPQIDLAVIGYKERRVMVQGMVNNQSFVVFPPEEDLTLLGAISKAGGWSNNRLANKEKVLIKRVVEGEVKEFTIDATKIGPLDWPLKDGDVVEVPERRF
jgi:polysaccharide export outer membrane protein